MTLRLVLMRHAKSDWGNANTTDHDRTLNERGVTDCVRVGRWLATQNIAPDQALCSSALRAQETWAGVAAHLRTPPQPEIDEALYLAAPDTMLEALQQATGSCIAMIAHNPGTAALAWHLSSVQLDHPGFGKYPTLGTLVLDFNISDWKALSAETGLPVHFVVPRELPL